MKERVRIDVLLRAYAAERADDTQTVTSMFGLLTASIGLVTLVGFALVNHARVPGWLLALAPMLPIPFIAFGALLSHVAQIRGRVIDDYEYILRSTAAKTEPPEERLIPYGHTILDRCVWQAPYARIVILLSFVSFFTGYVLVIVKCFQYSARHDFGLALFGLVFSSAATATLIGLFVVALFPRYWLQRGLKQLAEHEAERARKASRAAGTRAGRRSF